ncbi:ACT domain-containing protein [Pseudomonas stutzeri]|nr:ACT domain-containing protein [Stutzerimonas stutzeri]
MDHLVLTVMAPDRPGLVETLAKCVAEQGGNWLESRMARMAGQFAGILRVAVPAERHQALEQALLALAGQGVRVLLAPCGPEPVGSWQPIFLELVGNDRPGIVRDIGRLLSEHGINVESLTTEVLPAPMSSEPLFRAEALLGVPAGLPLQLVQEHLETLADDLMVELKLRSAGE